MNMCDFCRWRPDCYQKYSGVGGYCKFEADPDKVMNYAKENRMSVSDAVLLIKFCCGF